MSRMLRSSTPRRIEGQGRRYKKVVAVVALLSLTTTARLSLAQDDAAINDAYEKSAQGLSAYNSSQYAEALDKFTRAFAIVKLPALAVQMARANVKLGHLIAAAELYERATQLGDGIGDPQVQVRARAEARKERAALLLRTPKLLIQIRGVEPSTVSVSVDGTRLSPASFDSGWPLDPGTHKVTATFGAQGQEQMASVAEGEVREIGFEFSPTALQKLPTSVNSPDEPGQTAMTPMRTAAWVSFGVGGTGLLIWGASGIVALSKSEHFKSVPCGQPGQLRCDPTERDSYNTWRTLAGVGFYTGVA